MRIKYGELEIEAIVPQGMEGHNRDFAALQREMKWKISEINEMTMLEGPAQVLCVFFSLRAVGRLISYAKAEELLDEVEWIVEPGDLPGTSDDPAEEGAGDPTPAPTGSDRGDAPADEEPAETVSPL